MHAIACMHDHTILYRVRAIYSHDTPLIYMRYIYSPCLENVDASPYCVLFSLGAAWLAYQHTPQILSLCRCE